jgi:uroporphyrinogen-III synthase
MRIIVTRPLDDASILADNIKSLGHVPLLMPLLSIVSRADIKIPKLNYQAICITSAGAARAIRNISFLAEVPLLAVGPQSADAARKAGFRHVKAEGGDVIGLSSYIQNHLDPRRGPLLYLSGAETSGDLAGRLRDVDFTVERVICYDAVAQPLSEYRNDIESAEAVMLYSPRSAQLWLSGISSLGIKSTAERLLYFCLSENVAAALPQSWAKRIAQSPNESAMLDLLDKDGKAE